MREFRGAGTGGYPVGNFAILSLEGQVHAELDRSFIPADPQAAYLAISNRGHNLEARLAGSGLLSNNLAAVLDRVREDAFYARILFLFLGAPGLAAAALLTIAVA